MTMSTYKSLGGPAVGPDPHQRRRARREARPHRLSRADRQFRCGEVGGAGHHAARLEGARERPMPRRWLARPLPWPTRWRSVACRCSRPRGAAPRRISSRSRRREFGGGQAAARRLRLANILSCGIGLPLAEVEGDMNGLRFGTPEIVRWGMTESDMPELAALIARALKGNEEPQAVAADVTTFRRRFGRLHFIRHRAAAPTLRRRNRSRRIPGVRKTKRRDRSRLPLLDRPGALLTRPPVHP